MNGARIGITGARRATEQAALVTSLGGVAVAGPALRPDAPEPDAVIAPVLDDLLREPVDVFVFLTGAGAGVIFDHAGRTGREEAFRERLASARIVVRGTKPRRVLRALGVEVDLLVSPPSPPPSATRCSTKRSPACGSSCRGSGPTPSS